MNKLEATKRLADLEDEASRLRAFLTQRSGAGGVSELTDMLERMRAMSDNAYCDYISQMRRDECLGWQIKVERGKFGEAELKAHCAAAEKLGRHRALHEVAKMLEEACEQ